MQLNKYKPLPRPMIEWSRPAIRCAPFSRSVPIFVSNFYPLPSSPLHEININCFRLHAQLTLSKWIEAHSVEAHVFAAAVKITIYHAIQPSHLSKRAVNVKSSLDGLCTDGVARRAFDLNTHWPLTCQQSTKTKRRLKYCIFIFHRTR